MIRISEQNSIFIEGLYELLQGSCSLEQVQEFYNKNKFFISTHTGISFHEMTNIPSKFEILSLAYVTAKHMHTPTNQMEQIQDLMNKHLFKT